MADHDTDPFADTAGNFSRPKKKQGKGSTSPLAHLGDAVKAARAAALEATGMNATPTEILDEINKAVIALQGAEPLFQDEGKLCTFGQDTAIRLLAAYTIAQLEALALLRKRIAQGSLTGKDLVQAIEGIGRQMTVLKANGLVVPGHSGVPTPTAGAPVNSTDDASEALIDAAIAEARKKLGQLDG